MEQWKRKFYKSKQWRSLSAYVYNRDKGVCRRCNRLITDKHSVHHTIVLNSNNYTDPSISLNEKLLELLCEQCHNKEHNRFGGDSFVSKEKNKINYDKREELLYPPYMKKPF